MKMPNNLGMVLLAIWLIVWGAQAFVTITFINVAIVLAVLAVIAGILLLVGR